MTIELPDWFQELVDSITSINKSAITDPVVELYSGPEIEGWTVPPFICMICGDTFEEDADDPDYNPGIEYTKHLMSHITAFHGGWFEGGTI
jgi:hypothetical protein